MADAAPIVHAPAPWVLKGDIYIASFFTKAGLPEHAYSPLEGASAYASPESGRHCGGPAQFQIIRYTESPVGPYDELIVCPGFYEYEVEEGNKRKTKKNVRISRIYVSQKYTCWNGRHNWNIPKHLARFEFEDRPDGSTFVKVFPHDTTGDPAEACASELPFFQMNFKPIRWLPSFPFSIKWVGYLGLDLGIVQPPLPEGPGSRGELPGTDRWCRIEPNQTTRHASIGWADLSQKNSKGVVATTAGPENFWPGLGRWQIGAKLKDAIIDFGEGIHWDGPKSNQ